MMPLQHHDLCTRQGRGGLKRSFKGTIRPYRPLLGTLWRRHKQHNRTERRAVEYCMYIQLVWPVGWPRNGYLAISRNTKLDEIKHFFRGISAEFREIPRKDFAKISHIFAKYFCYFRGISRNFAEFRGIISNFEKLVTNFQNFHNFYQKSQWNDDA